MHAWTFLWPLGLADIYLCAVTVAYAQSFCLYQLMTACPDDKYLNKYVRGKVCAAGANKWRDLGIVLIDGTR